MSLELVDHERLEALQAIAALLEDDAAAQGDHGRGEAHDEAIAGSADQRLLHAELHQALLLRPELGGVEQDELPEGIGRTGVHAHLHAVDHWPVEVA